MRTNCKEAAASREAMNVRINCQAAIADIVVIATSITIGRDMEVTRMSMSFCHRQANKCRKSPLVH
jgi:hypothetical protein